MTDLGAIRHHPDVVGAGSPDLTIALHHVKRRANGGTDAPDNLTCPCAFCHLEGEHGDRLKILPPGNNPTWLLGRHPIMRVHRRERTLLA